MSLDPEAEGGDLLSGGGSMGAVTWGPDAPVPEETRASGASIVTGYEALGAPRRPGVHRCWGT